MAELPVDIMTHYNIVTVQDTPFVTINKSNGKREYTGFTIDLLKELAHRTVWTNEKKRAIKQKWVFWVKSSQNFKNSI